MSPKPKPAQFSKPNSPRNGFAGGQQQQQQLRRPHSAPQTLHPPPVSSRLGSPTASSRSPSPPSNPSGASDASTNLPHFAQPLHCETDHNQVQNAAEDDGTGDSHGGANSGSNRDGTQSVSGRGPYHQTCGLTPLDGSQADSGPQYLQGYGNSHYPSHHGGNRTQARARPWVPAGAPGGAWRPLGGVNEVSSLDREKIEKEKEKPAHMPEVDAATKENLQLLMGYGPDWERQQLEEMKQHHISHGAGGTASLRSANSCPPKLQLSPRVQNTRPPELGGLAAELDGRGPWHRASGGHGHPGLFDGKGYDVWPPNPLSLVPGTPVPHTPQAEPEVLAVRDNVSEFASVDSSVGGENSSASDLEVLATQETMPSDSGTVLDIQHQDMRYRIRCGSPRGTPRELADLADKHCASVLKGARPFSDEEANNLLRSVTGWKVVSTEMGLKLRCDWNVRNFIAGMQLFQRIATLATVEKHHPDLHLVESNMARAEVWSHTIGGLSENDFILAAKIGRLNVADLVSRPTNFE